MGLLSFRGGIHPPHAKKSTEELAIVKAVEPSVVAIPLRQHIGAPCEPLVQKGDTVKVGQKIGETTSFVCAPVHSSVSGTVKEVVSKPTLGGADMCVVIENDGQNTLHESVKPKGDIGSLSKEEILSIIKDAGIVGMGGAGFPTHVKLSPPPEKAIDVVILNGAECEPYLTADHRLMLETPEDVVDGLRAIMKSLGVTKGYIGIEDNKPNAIKVMTDAAKAYGDIEVVGLHTKYPQGAEKQLIYACTQREVPSGGLPMDAGAVVNNVATAAAVANVIKTGMPLVDRVCTITGGAIAKPQNLLIKNGTLLSEIVDQCGGFKVTPGKIILGGPMMGLATDRLDIPSTKTTSGILCFDEKEGALPQESNCIKCGKCVEICPAFIQPAMLSAFALKDMFEQAEANHILDCIECGSCSFVCPAKRPLLHSIRVAKRLMGWMLLLKL
jgi:electron transport complex protein RnfC